MKLQVFLFVVILSIVSAQVKPRCTETPPKWSGYFREINYDAGPGQVGFRFASISYDREEKKLKIVEFERREGDQRDEKATELLLFNENTRYRVDEGKCIKGEIPTEITFPDFGVPPNATFYGYDILGSEKEGDGVGVDQFHRYHDTNSQPRSGSYHGSYAPVGSTAGVCIPVLNSFVNTESRLRPEQMNIHTTFMNLTTVVSSDAFAVPKECMQLVF